MGFAAPIAAPNTIPNATPMGTFPLAAPIAAPSAIPRPTKPVDFCMTASCLVRSLTRTRGGGTALLKRRAEGIAGPGGGGCGNAPA